MDSFLRALKAIHPIKEDAGEYYMRFGIYRTGNGDWYWFAIGRADPSVVQWQYSQMLPKFMKAIVWG